MLVLFPWLVMTVVLFAFGPYDYPIPSPLKLWTFLIAVHAAILAGYLRGTRSKGRMYRGATSTLRITKVALLIVAAAYLLNLILTGGGDVARVILVFRDPLKAYTSSSIRGASLFNYLGIILSPLTGIGLALGCYYWSSLRRFYKSLLVFIVVTALLAAIGAAVRGSMIFLGVFTASGIASRWASGEMQLSPRRRRMLVLTAVILVAAFFQYFGYLAENRAGLRTDVLLNPITMERPDLSSTFYKVLPESWHTSATVAVFYVSHAYYRLSLAMEMPFEGIGFGAGNSMFLVRNVVRLTGSPKFEDRSVGVRLDKTTTTFSLGNWWATFYAWVASDVTFPGVCLVVFLITYLLALTWADIRHQRNPMAVPALASLFFIVYAFPMNNPLQDGGGIAMFGGIPLLWLVTRSRTARLEDKVVA
jgi:hypothetical protein